MTDPSQPAPSASIDHETYRSDIIDRITPRAALATSGAALACAACCVLPIAFPAIALVAGGALLAWIDGLTKAAFVGALILVVAGWAWVGWRSRTSGKRAARATIRMMTLATAIFAAGLAFPLYEPLIIRAIRG